MEFENKKFQKSETVENKREDQIDDKRLDDKNNKEIRRLRKVE